MERIFILNEPNAPRINPALAKEIGLNESLMLLQIEFWISISDNQHNGKRWTYQSVRDIQEKAFPFWSIATISRTLKKLIDMGLLIEGNFNKRKYDKTRWFALNLDEISKLKSILVPQKSTPNQNETRSNQNETRSNQNETRSNQNETRSNQNETTIPEITTEITTETSTEGEGDKEPPAPKKKYGEFVRMTEKECLQLIEKLGNKVALDYIERLNNYIGSKGKRYRSHYHTILAWHRKDKDEGLVLKPQNKSSPKMDMLRELYAEAEEEEQGGIF